MTYARGPSLPAFWPPRILGSPPGSCQGFSCVFHYSKICSQMLKHLSLPRCRVAAILALTGRRHRARRFNVWRCVPSGTPANVLAARRCMDGEPDGNANGRRMARRIVPADESAGDARRVPDDAPKKIFDRGQAPCTPCKRQKRNRAKGYSVLANTATTRTPLLPYCESASSLLR